MWPAGAEICRIDSFRSPLSFGEVWDPGDPSAAPKGHPGAKAPKKHQNVHFWQILGPAPEDIKTFKKQGRKQTRKDNSTLTWGGHLILRWNYLLGPDAAGPNLQGRLLSPCSVLWRRVGSNQPKRRPPRLPGSQGAKIAFKGRWPMIHGSTEKQWSPQTWIACWGHLVWSHNLSM